MRIIMYYLKHWIERHTSPSFSSGCSCILYYTYTRLHAHRFKTPTILESLTTPRNWKLTRASLFWSDFISTVSSLHMQDRILNVRSCMRKLDTVKNHEHKSSSQITRNNSLSFRKIEHTCTTVSWKIATPTNIVHRACICPVKHWRMITVG